MRSGNGESEYAFNGTRSSKADLKNRIENQDKNHIRNYSSENGLEEN